MVTFNFHGYRIFKMESTMIVTVVFAMEHFPPSTPLTTHHPLKLLSAAFDNDAVICFSLHTFPPHDTFHFSHVCGWWVWFLRCGWWLNVKIVKRIEHRRSSFSNGRISFPKAARTAVSLRLRWHFQHILPHLSTHKHCAMNVKLFSGVPFRP